VKSRRDLVVALRAATLCVALSACAPAVLVAPGATPKTLASGYQFTEGPAVDAAGNVYFSDIPAARIYKWTHADGKIALYREQTGQANGLMFDHEGRLVICEMGRHRISRDDMHGNVVMLADAYKGEPLHMPNDLWVDARGGVYFSDFQLPAGENQRMQVYYIPPDGTELRRATDDLVAPNGLIGTPDGKTLYITDPGDGRTWSYSVNADGSLAAKKLFVAQGGDGMALDEHNNLYLAGGGVSVFAPSGQKLLEIAMPNRTSNLKFAGKERRTLFITARDTVYTLDMRVRGAPGPAH
jgi:gluconolactonase